MTTRHTPALAEIRRTIHQAAAFRRVKLRALIIERTLAGLRCAPRDLQQAMTALGEAASLSTLKRDLRLTFGPSPNGQRLPSQHVRRVAFSRDTAHMETELLGLVKGLVGICARQVDAINVLWATGVDHAAAISRIMCEQNELRAELEKLNAQREQRCSTPADSTESRTH